MLHDRGCASVERCGELKIEGRGEVEVDVHICVDEDKVGVKYARARVEESGPGVDMVVVSVDGPTPFTKKEFGSIQFCLARDLCVNITRHALVPKHERVDAPPAGIDAASLPVILHTDPVVMYYNFPPGTILRISRVFGGHEPTFYYRVVVVDAAA